MFFALFVLEIFSIQDVVIAVFVIIGSIITLKTGVLQTIFTSSKERIEQLTKERDAQSVQLIEMKAENNLLRREANQRLEINIQDQQHLRKLKGIIYGTGDATDE